MYLIYYFNLQKCIHSPDLSVTWSIYFISVTKDWTESIFEGPGTVWRSTDSGSLRQPRVPVCLNARVCSLLVALIFKNDTLWVFLSECTRVPKKSDAWSIPSRRLHLHTCSLSDAYTESLISELYSLLSGLNNSHIQSNSFISGLQANVIYWNIVNKVWPFFRIFL